MQLRKYFQLSIKYSLILLLIASSWVISGWIQNSTNITNDRISFEIITSKGGMFQLFYSSNNQHSQKNSSIINTRGSESFQAIQFTVNKSSLTNIRFDPPSDVQIKSIVIGRLFNSEKYTGQKLFEILKPINDIENVDLVNNTVFISTKGIDPHLQISGIRILNPSTLKSEISKCVFRLIVFCLLILISIFSIKIITTYQAFLFNQNNKVNISRNLFKALRLIIFSWFLFQMLYFALNVKIGASPDERYHIGVSRLYSEPWVFRLENTEATYKLGSVTTNPHFYYLAMGKLLMLKPDFLIDYLYLRFINIIISLFSLYLTYLLSKEITSNKFIQLSILIAQTNILMFVFLSSMVNYDNLVNLLAVASFLFLFRFINNFNLTYLLLLLLNMVVGALTKATYLPLILFEVFVLLFYMKKIFLHKPHFFSEIGTSKNIMISIGFFIFFGANIYLYGGNLLKYQKIKPGGELVIGKENALKGYGIYMRNSNLLSTAHTREVMPLSKYVPMYFTRTIETIFSVVGHLSIQRGIPELRFYLILLAFCFSISIYHYKIIFSEQKLIILLLLITCYLLIIFYVNYSTYYQMRVFGIGLHGRYNFPVISLMVIFLMNTLLFKLSDRAKIPVILIITYFLVNNSFFWFLERVTQIWFIT